MGRELSAWGVETGFGRKERVDAWMEARVVEGGTWGSQCLRH